MARPRLVPLKPKSEIDGIRLERVASVAPSMLLYDGVDTATDDRVVVREYFPAAIASREAGGSGVQPASPADKAAFEAGLNSFVDHGRALYPFRHRNVVGLRAMVEANGTAYFIADHVDGALLDDLLEPGDALVVDEIEEILPGLLDGLAALHHGRLLHRGIAPGTILIRRDGVPVLDLPAPAPGADDVAPPSLAPYVPSDWRESGAGARGDIYSLGATLYRLVTGHEPAIAQERATAAAAGTPDREAAALAALDRAWPRAVRNMIAACMNPVPDKRPGSVSAVRDLLEEPGRPVAVQLTASPTKGAGSSKAGDGAAGDDASGRAEASGPIAAPGPTGEEQPPTKPRRDRPRADVVTQPATGADRPQKENGPRHPGEVSTVWLGSGGAKPTELPRRRTERPDPKAGLERRPTESGRDRQVTEGGGRRAEPSFRREPSGTPPAAPTSSPIPTAASRAADDDGPPTVRIARSAPTRAPSGSPTKPPTDPSKPTGSPAPPRLGGKPEGGRRGDDETPTKLFSRGGRKSDPGAAATQPPPLPESPEDVEEPPTVPFRRTSAADTDDAPRAGEAAGVIYRKGAATPVRAPAKPTLGAAPGAAATGESPSGAPVVPAALNLIAPAALPERGWRDLVVYLHDPGLASLLAKHIDDNPAPGTMTEDQPLEAQNLIVAPGTPLTVVPSIVGARTNPAQITVAWHEAFHRLDFRIGNLPGEKPVGGVVRLFLGPILLAEAPVDLSGDPAGPPVRSGVRGYRAPFFSYVAGDLPIVEPLGAAARRLRSPATARAMARRDTPWDRDILPLIEQADGLFIFWSAEASRSPNLRKEWEFALELYGPEFIRLISWVDPMPAPPIELKSVPIIRLDPAQLAVPDGSGENPR